MSRHEYGSGRKYVPIPLGVRIQNEGGSTQHHLSGALVSKSNWSGCRPLGFLPSFRIIQSTDTFEGVLRTGAGTQKRARRGRSLPLLELMRQLVTRREQKAINRGKNFRAISVKNTEQ